MTSIKEQLKTLFPEHSYNKVYKKDDIVTHTSGEDIDFYVAKQNVPRFVSIYSKGYWKAINNIEVKGKPQPTPGGKPNFYLIPPYISEGNEIPCYGNFNNIIRIEGPLFQYQSETDEGIPDVDKIKIGNNIYNVQVVQNEPDELESGIYYMLHFMSMEITPEVIEQLASLGITIDLSNGNYVCVSYGWCLSDETHGDLTATFYDSNGNGSSIVIKEYVEPVEEPDYLCFTAEKAGATLRMVGQYTEGHEDDFALEYSTDGETWQDLNFTASDGSSISDTLTFENIGDKVCFRGDNVKGTTDINVIFTGEGYSYVFAGGENTPTLDNQFAVSGDIQTLVSKDGSNKTAGCFGGELGLFYTYGDDDEVTTGYIVITSAPKLTATRLTFGCYLGLFNGQFLLTEPAEMPSFTFNDIRQTTYEIEGIPYYGYCFCKMYSNTSLTTLPDFSLLSIDFPAIVEEFSEYGEDAGLEIISILFESIYRNVPALMTNDNNTLINFGTNTYMESGEFTNDYDFAIQILNNINGYDYVDIQLLSSGGGDVTKNKGGHIWIPTNSSTTIILTATPDSGYHFVKWQSSNDEGSTWTDIQDATNTTYTITLTQAGNYYYKAVFEQD